MTVTRMVPKPITETVAVCVTKMVPHSSTVTVPTVKCRPVTETVTRQVSVCVPYQVPVTVMTTQTRRRRSERDGTGDRSDRLRADVRVSAGQSLRAGPSRKRPRS